MNEQLDQDMQEMLADVHPELTCVYFGPWEEEITLANGEVLIPQDGFHLLDVRRPMERGELGILLPFSSSYVAVGMDLPRMLRPMIEDAYEKALGEPIHG